jgi:hypothetical protein
MIRSRPCSHSGSDHSLNRYASTVAYILPMGITERLIELSTTAQAAGTELWYCIVSSYHILIKVHCE